MRHFKFLLFIFLAACCASQSKATWSIIAVDRVTGEIGIAGASCTFDVQGIASIVPGKGAIVVQAASSYFARMKGVSMMRAGATPEALIEAMTVQDYEPDKQQIGVISLTAGSKPLVYSGSLIKDWSGSKTAQDFAVLGNILVSEQVIVSAFDVFNHNRDKSLEHRLMLALSAGAKAKGDKRCGDQHATSAFVSVYNPNNKAIKKLAIYGIEKGGDSAVKLLGKEQKKSLQGPAGGFLPKVTV